MKEVRSELPKEESIDSPEELEPSGSSELKDLLSLTQSDSEEEIFATLQDALPSLTKESIEVLKSAIAGKNGFSVKERASYAKFILSTAMKMQSVAQGRKLEAIKTHIETTARIASDTSLIQNTAGVVTSAAMTTLHEAFMAIPQLGSGKAPPLKLVTATQPAKKVKPKKKRKTISSVSKMQEGKVITNIPEWLEDL